MKRKETPKCAWTSRAQRESSSPILTVQLTIPVLYEGEARQKKWTPI